MHRDEIEHRLGRAVNRLLERDRDLLERDVNERSITHWLALYVMEEFKDLRLDVDCEYNRNGREPKRILRLVAPRLAEEIACDQWPEDDRARTVYPDIVIHRRNENADNFLVIEVKKGFGSSGADEEKIVAYMSEPLNYRHGATIELGVGDTAGTQPRIEVFCRADSSRLEISKGVSESG